MLPEDRDVALLWDMREACRSVAEFVAGPQRIVAVQPNLVFVAQGHSDAALRVPRVRGRDRCLREQEHVRLRCGRERRVEARDSPSDDDDVGFSPQSR